MNDAGMSCTAWRLAGFAACVLLCQTTAMNVLFCHRLAMFWLPRLGLVVLGILLDSIMWA
jgi:hypothetical protein